MKYLFFLSILFFNNCLAQLDTSWGITYIRHGNGKFIPDSNQKVLRNKFINWLDGSLSGMYYEVKYYTTKPKGYFDHCDTIYFLLDGNKIMVVDSVIKRTWYFKEKAYKAKFDTCDNYGPCGLGMFGISDDSVTISNNCGNFKYSINQYDSIRKIHDSINALIPEIDTSSSEYENKATHWFYLNNHFKPIREFHITKKQMIRTQYIEDTRYFDPIYRRKHKNKSLGIIECG